jgi:putative aminopeptidase FrvX
MDQVGYMVSRIEADRAHCLPVGKPQLDERQTTGVRVLGDDHPTLLGEFESFGTGGGVLHCDRLDEIRVGDQVVFSAELQSLDDGRVRGAALDDRVGCLVALRAAQVVATEELDVAFAWTVREETEQAGVLRVARDLEPELVVAVDITYATSDEQTAESVVAAGHGPAITLMDGGMVGHGRLVRAFELAANRLGTSWQPEVVRAGASEAGRVQSLLGIPALALLVPIDNPHTHQETAHLQDVASVIDLLVAGIRELANEPEGDTTHFAAATTPRGTAR